MARIYYSMVSYIYRTKACYSTLGMFNEGILEKGRPSRALVRSSRIAAINSGLGFAGLGCRAVGFIRTD